jgi:hypothetical protein
MDRQTLYSSFYKQDLPVEKLSDDSIRHKELLFDEGAKNVSWRSRGVLDMTNSYIVENDSSMAGNSGNVQPKKVVNPVQNKQLSAGQSQNKPTSNNNARGGNWRQNATENNVSQLNDTVEFLKGGMIGNKSEVEDFVRGKVSQNQQNPQNPQNGKYDNFNFDNTMNNDPNFTYENKNFNDTMEEPSTFKQQPQQNILGNISESDINLSSSQFNEYFKNPNSSASMYQQINQGPRPFPFPVQIPFGPMIPIQMMPNMPNMPNIPSAEKVKIENIFNFNKKINYPNDLPLWYISLPWSPMLNGPISSNGLVEMYNKRAIDSNYGFKPIDVFHFRNLSGKNEIASLTILNNDNWADDIQDSPYLQYTELYHTSKKLLENEKVHRVNEKKESKETTLSQTSSNKKKEPIATTKKESEKILIKEEPKSNKSINLRSPKNKQKQVPIPDDTLQLTTIEIKKEIRNFMDDTEVIQVVQEQPKNTHSDLSNYVHIVKDVEDTDENWEKVDKKKKKNKDHDPSFYLIGTKPKKEEKKESRPTQKVAIVPPEDLLKDLMPKHLREENKPNYQAFNVVEDGNDGFTQVKKKKLKGKPQELNVKLGFKI